MGNLMGCFIGYNTKGHDVFPSVSGIPGSNTSGQVFSSTTTTTTTTTSSSSGKSGYSFGDNPSFGELLEKPNLRVFSFGELKSATRGFRNDTILGEGGFGKVYRGYIDDKLAVAIKKLNSQSLQGFEEWQSEVNFLGRLSHPNLVKLLGYCWEDRELLLVYEYLSQGSLENHLFGRMSSVEPLSWERRLSIISGVAKGLAFLHTSDKQVIYRDFKAANILLDKDYNAKLSDFGMAKLGPSGENSHVTTRVMGTYGYAAPEYVTTGHLYVNSDVYGFGVVLLEILTGLRALDLNRPNGQQNLVQRSKHCLSNKRSLRTIMDVRLQGQYSLKAAFELAQLALKCLVSEPKARPCMKDVVEVLEKAESGIVEKPQQRKNRTISSKKTQKANHNRQPR